MGRYPISRELFPFSHFAPPISERFLKIAAANMRVPKKFLNAKGVQVTKHTTGGCDGAAVEYYVIAPDGIRQPDEIRQSDGIRQSDEIRQSDGIRQSDEIRQPDEIRQSDGIRPKAPCLFYIHGGGFVLKAAGYHYMNCLRYAKEAGCVVVFPDYRLAPEHPFPIFYEDCYSVFCELYEKAEEYGIDRSRIGVGGDSAGATLAAGLCMMAQERRHPVRFVFQMLPYPYLDARNSSESCRKYTDTPMWNSTLSGRITPMTNVDRNDPSYVWYSPVEADDFSIFPPAYIETAEFDCLHDDGVLFAEELRSAGVEVTLNETKGTMHGYDIVRKASVSLASMERRIAFMKGHFAERAAVGNFDLTECTDSENSRRKGGIVE